MFLDEREDSIDDGYFGVDMVNPLSAATWVNYPACYHDRAAGFAFADGHAEIKRWSDARTTPPLVRGAFIPTYVASPNNCDLAWVRDRCSAPRGGL